METTLADPSSINLRGTLPSMLAELERQKATKLDFCADARTLRICAKGTTLFLMPELTDAGAQTSEFLDKSGHVLNPSALDQLAARVSPEIPTRFLRALATNRPAFCGSLLTGLMHATGKRYLIRCLDSRVRAILSDRYRILDNYDFVFQSLEAIKEHNGIITSCSLSDTRMRLSFTTAAHHAPRPNEKNGGSAHVPGSHSFAKGAVLANGMVVGNVYPFFNISNSETGHGGIAVEQGLYDPQCSNGLIIEKIIGRVHLGEKLDAGVFTEETQAADSRAIMLKARDAIRAALTSTNFTKMIALATEAQSDLILAPTMAVGNFLSNASLPDSLKDSLLTHFLKDYDATRYGLASAVSRLAQDQTSVDDAATLESLAGDLIKSPALLTA